MCLSSVMSVYCSLVVNCWEKADLLALLCVMFSFAFVCFPCGVLGQVWNFIVSIPDLCLLLYFVEVKTFVLVFKRTVSFSSLSIFNIFFE